MFVRLMVKLDEEKTEKMLWDLYLAKFPQMTKDDPSFDEYKRRVLTPIDNTPAEDILAESERIMIAYNKKVGEKK